MHLPEMLLSTPLVVTVGSNADWGGPTVKYFVGGLGGLGGLGGAHCPIFPSVLAGIVGQPEISPDPKASSQLGGVLSVFQRKNRYFTLLPARPNGFNRSAWETANRCNDVVAFVGSGDIRILLSSHLLLSSVMVL